MRRSPLVPVVLLAVLGSLLVAQPAAAAEVPVVATWANTYPDETGGTKIHPQIAADGDAEMISGTLSGGIVVNLPSGSVQFLPPQDQELHVGRFTSDPRTSSPDPASVTVSQGTTQWTRFGEFDVRQISADAAGNVTAFDIVFRTGADSSAYAFFGQIRLGPSVTPERLSATQLTWPQTPVGGLRTWAPQSFRNTTAQPVRLGRIAIGGAAHNDWVLADDTCSGVTVAAGGTCTYRVGFSPKAAGPREASVTVPTGDGVLTTALDGSTPLGTTELTSIGDEVVHKGKTAADRESDGRSVFRQDAAVGGWWRFTVDVPYSSAGGVHRLDLSGTNGTITPGKHKIASFGDKRRNGMGMSVGSYGCNVLGGTEDVRSIAFAPDGSIDHARITFAFDCAEAQATADFRWRDRADVTPPTKPRGLTLTGVATRTVTWTPAPNRDTTDTIVRLVPGDGTNAIPSSGFAVGNGLSGSAVLPALPTGAQYTLMAWAVDATGNVGIAQTRPFRT